MNHVPNGWTVEPFERVAVYNTGRTPARANPEYWLNDGDSVAWISISDMEDYGTVTHTSETISGKAFREVFHHRIVPAGTLLMSFKLTIGRVATSGVPACHNEAIISIHPRSGVDQRYLGYYLSQIDYSEHQDRQVKGNTLNQAKINRLPILLPPWQEQCAIADLLDQLRAAIRTETDAGRVISRLKRTVMRKLFASGLRGEPQKETEIGPVPESWEVVQLGRLGKIGNGSTPQKSVAAYWEGGEFPWLTSAKVYDRDIRTADQFVTAAALNECHLPLVRPGAILLAITGQGKTLGHCAVLRTDATISQHLAYVQMDTQKAEPGFVRGYIETQYEYLRQVASGGGSTKGALTCAFLRMLPVPLAGMDEQREIVAILDVIDHKVELHRQKRAVLEDLFKALLPKLMTSEIRLTDLGLAASGGPIRTATADTEATITASTSDAPA